MTRDQERARELISLIEGTNLVAEETDRHLTLTSETGQSYVVDREARLAKEKERTITEALGQAA